MLTAKCVTVIFAIPTAVSYVPLPSVEVRDKTAEWANALRSNTFVEVLARMTRSSHRLWHLAQAHSLGVRTPPRPRWRHVGPNVLQRHIRYASSLEAFVTRNGAGAGLHRVPTRPSSMSSCIRSRLYRQARVTPITSYSGLPRSGSARPSHVVKPVPTSGIRLGMSCNSGSVADRWSYGV